MLTFRRPSSKALALATIGAIGLLCVLVYDSWRSALLALLTLTVVRLTRLRFAAIIAVTLAAVIAGMAYAHDGPSLDTRPVAAVAHAPTRPAHRHRSAHDHRR